MTPRDIALAIAVAAAWGFNFVVISVGLDTFPPLLFSALRFGLAAFPALLFVGRPRVAWRWVFAVGLALGVVKFSLLFAGMDAGMPAGLSSLVLQGQAVFTLAFAAILLAERPGPRRLVGVALACAGIAVVAWRVGPDRPLGAFLLVIAAAAAWGLSNVAMRRSATDGRARPGSAPTDMVRFMVWVSAVATLPLFALSLLVEGPSTAMAAIHSIDLTAAAAVAYIAWVATLAGFGAWGALINRYGASTVAPFSMLVPLFGIASAAVVLGEPVHLSDLLGGALVVGGVLLGATARTGPHQRHHGDAAPAPVRARPTGPPASAGPLGAYQRGGPLRCGEQFVPGKRTHGDLRVRRQW